MSNIEKIDEQIKEYRELRDMYKQLGLAKNENYKKVIKKIFHFISPYCRSYNMEIIGLDNIDFSEAKVFVSNHSNSHDFFTIQEVFKDMVHIFAAEDSLDKLTKFVFQITGVELIDRRDKDSCSRGVNNLVKYLVNGESVLILPEGTWNIHPSKPMLPMKHGAVLVSKMSHKPIVPVIFEYIENNNICEKEKDIYDKCIVKFLNSISVDDYDDLSEATIRLRDIMATARWEIWEKNGIIPHSDLKPLMMKNHQDLKTNTSTFVYDNEYELQFILGNKNPIYEEYPLNGISYDERGKQLIKK